MKKINSVLVKNDFLNFKSFLLGVSIFTLMIDSGGSLGLRNFGFIVFILFALPNLFRSSINKNVFIIIGVAILIFFVGIFSYVINNIEISKAYQWMVFLPLIYVFYKSFLIFNKNDFINGFLFAGFLFSISVLSIHFMLVTELFISEDELLNILKENFNGFFHHYLIFEFNYYSIYFQATLTLVVFAVIAYLNKNYKLYNLFLFIMFISLSRFGVFICFLIPIIIYLIGEDKLSKIITIYFIPFSCSIIIIYYITYLYSYDISFSVSDNMNSSISRVISVISTVDSISYNNFFFGQGPGSEFYNLSYSNYTNNTELSQLEFLRKFGIIGFILFHILIFLTMYFNHKKYFYTINIYIFTFYLASMSNPILTSLTFSMLVGYSLSRISKNNLKEII